MVKRMKTNIQHPTSNIQHRTEGEQLWHIRMLDVRRNSAILITALLLLPSILTGCQPSPPATSAPKATISAAPLPAGRQPTVDETLAADPCSTRLEDIEGAMLMYYALNKQLPLSLEALKPFANTGTELKLTCPESNLPYVYSRDGLVAAGTDRRIIVWDPTPAHHGMRWCIVMPYQKPGDPLVPEVVPIQEKAFQAFVTPIQ
jgi:hypothetical protein